MTGFLVGHRLRAWPRAFSSRSPRSSACGGSARFAGMIQMRIGPQETGPFGLLPDASPTSLKLLLKEDITPDTRGRRACSASRRSSSSRRSPSRWS